MCSIVLAAKTRNVRLMLFSRRPCRADYKHDELIGTNEIILGLNCIRQKRETLRLHRFWSPKTAAYICRVPGKVVADPKRFKWDKLKSSVGKMYRVLDRSRNSKAPALQTVNMPSTQLLLRPEIRETDKLENICCELRTVPRAKGSVDLVTAMLRTGHQNQ